MNFKTLETQATGTRVSLDTLIAEAKWNTDGLMPAIAQCVDSGDVLMLAWMNEPALRETLTTGQVCYWSRSRQTYWRKGESSGHRQRLHQAFLDCDGDALLLKVTQSGPACHTNRRGCFYLALNDDGGEIISTPEA